MSDAGQVYVIDERRHDFYIVDNALILKYGQYIGPYAIAAYNCLVCHAGKRRVAWPSYNTIATEIGASRATAMRAIKTLEQWRMIRIEKKPPGEGQKEYENNRYHITDVSRWKPIPVPTETGGISQQPGSTEGAPGVVSILNGGSAPQIPEQDAGKQDKQQQDSSVVVASQFLEEIGL